jgi:predicted Zn-dependent protease
MSTFEERRIEKLRQRLKARTKHDGTPRPGFEQNVATIRAELEAMSERYAPKAEPEAEEDTPADE